MKHGTILFLLAFLVVRNTIAQKPRYEVYAIRFASSGIPFTAADWSDKAPTTDSVKIDFMVWLIKGDNGKNILFDAGFYNDLEDAKEFQVINYTRPDSVLSKLLLTPSEITDVIISHPHWDHIDGVDLFPKAQVWMQKEDFNYFVSTSWQKGNNHGGFKPRDVKKLIDLNLAGKLTLVDGDNKEIIPGIWVYTGSKHTYNSQYVGVKTGNNKIILASDNIWIYYSLDHLVPPSQGGTLDPEGYVNAMKRMKRMVRDPKFIIPGHDSRVLERFPKKAEGVVKIE